MVIRNKHPEYTNDKARAERLREVVQLCRQKLSAVRDASKTG